MARICGCGWSDELWCRTNLGLHRCRPIRRPHSKGRESEGFARPAADQIQSGDQSQDCQGARGRCAADTARVCRRGDRVKGWRLRLLALLRSPAMSPQQSLLEAKRTCRGLRGIDVHDPEKTSASRELYKFFNVWDSFRAQSLKS